MKIYTIAQEEHMVYGHGDSGSELQVKSYRWREAPEGMPPCFLSYGLAQEFLGKQLFFTGRVVELELRKSPDQETEPKPDIGFQNTRYPEP
jgi:hypothetical protein